MPEKDKDKDKGPQPPVGDAPATQQEQPRFAKDGSPLPRDGGLGPLAPENNPLPSKEEPKKLDETIPGGRYKTPDGRTVNANNEPIDENGKVIKPS
jgi:hypothetical protein